MSNPNTPSYRHLQPSGLYMTHKNLLLANSNEAIEEATKSLNNLRRDRGPVLWILLVDKSTKRSLNRKLNLIKIQETTTSSSCD